MTGTQAADAALPPRAEAGVQLPTRGTPPRARRRMLAAGAGWVVVALAEATAYTVLALAIRDGGGIFPVLGAAGVAVVLTVFVTRGGYLTGARLAGDLYAGIGRALARTKLSWFTARHRTRVTAAAGSSVPAFMGVPAHQLQTLVMSPLVPLFLVGAIWIVGGGAAAAVALGLLVLALAAQALSQRRLGRADADRLGLELAAGGATAELVDHLELLRTAAGPTRAGARAEAAWADHERAMARTNRAAAPATLVSSLASVTPLAGMLVFLAATSGFAHPTAALALILLTARASAPLDDLALAGLTLGAIRSDLATYRAVVDAPALRTPDTGATPAGTRIELERVTQPPALDFVTAQLPEGARVHVAGPSGAGKSTLLQLLMRFDDPEHGYVMLGGVPLTHLTEAEITARFAYVPQEATVLTGTVATNLRIGRPAASESELENAARLAQLGDVLDRHPLGLDQPVGARGQALSGGERQRLAIARALVRRAPILVLDEATSALDRATEERVAAALADYPGTLVFVTHRDPTVWRPDHTIDLTHDRITTDSKAQDLE